MIIKRPDQNRIVRGGEKERKKKKKMMHKDLSSVNGWLFIKNKGAPKVARSNERNTSLPS